jgi:starvation-inducible DNA-binding protein
MTEQQISYTAQLNLLLASYEIHYQNLRSLHWNIKGNNFFELHLKYEELYTRTQVIIDEVAERILTLGTTPLSRFSDYLQHSNIPENELISDGIKGMNYILKAQNSLLQLERMIINQANKNEDEGTAALMSDLVREKEKTNWMFAAWLG